MIEYIFISKVRLKLLKLFFLDTTEEIHIRGIVRKIGEEINAVRRELKNLEDAGILVSQKRGNRLYYKVDFEGHIFHELHAIINKEYGLGGKILEKLDQLGDVRYLLLTTAYIENHHPSQYDVDILVVGNVEMKVLSTAIKEAEKTLGREIRYTVMTEEEFIFRKKKRDNFITNILNKKKIMLYGDENSLMS